MIRLSVLRGLVLVAALGAALPARALDAVVFRAPGADAALEEALRAASSVLAAQRDGTTDGQDVFAAARAEYARLLGTLYAFGHYSGVITVRVDGREAASIAPLDAPAQVARVEVTVEPGPRFVFGRARIGPLAAGTDLPRGFAPGAVAESGQVAEAAEAAVAGWRDAGHAKAAVTRQDIVADHASATLDADLGVAAGPRLRFGPLVLRGYDRMRPRRLAKIAGLPEGEVFSPAELDRAAERLRRTGVFRSVTLAEDEQITAPDLLGITATVVEEAPRRYGFGGEIASFDGATVSGYWLHRNLLGGAERLRIEGRAAQIGAQESGPDYRLGVTLDRPATITADTTASLHAEVERLDEADFTSDTLGAGLSFTHYFSNRLTARVGAEYQWSRVEDIVRTQVYRNVALPVGVTWDRRDNALDATRGFYVDAEAKPFLGLGVTDSGLRLWMDARAYRSLGEARRFTFAGRVQAGAVLGSSLLGTPRDMLFYSGGGGTVRGQPYQSLGVNVLRTDFRTGGQAFLGLSGEVRAQVTDNIGVVGFVDAGHVGALGFFDDLGDWHAGAGLGLRYATGFGPIRLDVAAPVGGDTGEGVQIYVGIGQAF
ncbi:MAG TPA: autotransporter assembly complex family protein [Paracoccaceae bacterium]|nr:autotransporter assembly complex family protein [Paracoccaceae bacterium]